MVIELDISKAVRQVASLCGVEEPVGIVTRSGWRYASGYDPKTDEFFFVQASGGEKVKAQNPFLHEAAHLVRLHQERTAGAGSGLVQELDRISKIVDESIERQGVLGEHYFEIWRLLFAKHASDELIGCFFGMDFDDQDALAQARSKRSLQTLNLFSEFLQGWDEEITTISNSSDSVDQVIPCLKEAENGGKIFGGIIGHILAEERANPRFVMLLDSTKLFTSIEKLAAESSFPENLESFFQETELLPISL